MTPESDNDGPSKLIKKRGKKEARQTETRTHTRLLLFLTTREARKQITEIDMEKNSYLSHASCVAPGSIGSLQIAQAISRLDRTSIVYVSCVL